MFAFVLYDSARDEYLVARDPFGIIPLYIGYAGEDQSQRGSGSRDPVLPSDWLLAGDGTTWFSSELKGLQKCCDHIEIFPPGHFMVGSSLKKSATPPEAQV